MVLSLYREHLTTRTNTPSHVRVCMYLYLHKFCRQLYLLMDEISHQTGPSLYSVFCTAPRMKGAALVFNNII